MNKEKEIEEMAEFISKNKRVEDSEWIANGLYDMGYRKITPNVDFVVRCSDLVNIREKAYNDARKETAKEILDLLIRYDDRDSNSEAIMLIIDHFGLKEYIEVDE